MFQSENTMLGTSLVGQEETTKSKGRTGWPQHMWALELKQETPSSQLQQDFKKIHDKFNY